MNSGSLPQNKARLAQIKVWSLICTGKCANFFDDETWQTRCHLTQNLMRIPKLSRSVGETVEVGWKMAEKFTTQTLHAPPWGPLGCHLAAKPPVSSFVGPAVALLQYVLLAGDWSTVNRDLPWLLENIEKKKKTRKKKKKKKMFHGKKRDYMANRKLRFPQFW